MSWTYRCTRCEALLNPHDTIVLVASRGDKRVLAGFHPEPGNYEIFFPPDVALRDGQRWDFSCPVCHHDLVSDQNENLCVLGFEEGGEKNRILFSRICGEKATFVVSGDKITSSLGEHARTYFELLMSVEFM